MKVKVRLFWSLLFFTFLILTGCQQTDTGGGGQLNKFFISPFSTAIEGAAHVLGGNYGLAMVFITILIRLVLLPFMLQQMKSQKQMGIRMNELKPELIEIQKKIKETTDIKEKQKLQQNIYALYKQRGVNPLNLGCLPLLLQFPILMGLYYAIRESQEISSHTFLWFNLGQPDIWVTLIAGLVYFLQFKVSQKQMTVEQQKQMKLVGLLSPIMIIFFSFHAPASLPLYWAVGGLFLALQSYLISKFSR
nr:membrane protein insertase YidC [Bacillus sp. Marseille-Q1617]